MWNDIIPYIRDNRNFVLTSHIHPDGDAIGSEIALAEFLEDIGKSVTVINSSATPDSLRFLDPNDHIQVYPDDYESAALQGADVAIVLDVNNWSHLGNFANALKKIPIARLCIDHHESLEDGFAEAYVTDTSAAATGVLVYELIKAMDGTVTERIGRAIYTALVTDCGNFRFSNTDARALRTAAELVEYGVEPFDIQQAVYTRTRSAVKLLGSVLATLDTTDNGRVAWIHATRRMFETANADYEDSDGILELVRSVQGVEYCFFFKELHDGRIKVSLRSNGRADVYEIAKRFGGGGHRMASGMTLDGPMQEAIRHAVATTTSEFPIV